MGMEAETGEGLPLIVDPIEEDKRFQDLAEISRAHQARDGAVRVAHDFGEQCVGWSWPMKRCRRTSQSPKNRAASIGWRWTPSSYAD